MRFYAPARGAWNLEADLKSTLSDSYAMLKSRVVDSNIASVSEASLESRI